MISILLLISFLGIGFTDGWFVGIITLVATSLGLTFAWLVAEWIMRGDLE